MALRRTRLSTRLQVGALIGCTLLTACGDDDDDDGGSAAGSGGRAGTAAAGSGGTSPGGSGGRNASGSGGARAAGAGGRSGAGGTSSGSGGTASEVDAGGGDDAGAPAENFSFFVSSDTNTTGDLGGLSGADERCERLADAVGAGDKTWHAYLSVEANGVNARDRIGSGPWYNAKGVLLANDLTALHALSGDAALFLDEHGARINGQWSGSPTPNEHDIFTGSNADGTLAAGKTCEDWTSTSAEITAQVGHSDGLGPMQNGAPPYNSWNSVHENESCANTAPRGGAGKIYCFAID